MFQLIFGVAKEALTLRPLNNYFCLFFIWLVKTHIPTGESFLNFAFINCWKIYFILFTDEWMFNKQLWVLHLFIHHIIISYKTQCNMLTVILSQKQVVTTQWGIDPVNNRLLLVSKFIVTMNFTFSTTLKPLQRIIYQGSC